MTSPDPTFIFDLGGVLVRHDNEVLHDRLAACCADPSNARAKIVGLLGDEKIGTGQLRIETLHKRLKDDLGFKASYAYFLDLWSSHFSAEPGMEALVQNLAKRHRTVLFSNTNAPHIDHIRAHYPVFGHVHASYLSYEIGLVKPSAASYLHVLQLEGREPGDCIFIDDRPENTAAAQRLGIRTVTFAGRDSFVAAISNHGVAL